MMRLTHKPKLKVLLNLERTLCGFAIGLSAIAVTNTLQGATEDDTAAKIASNILENVEKTNSADYEILYSRVITQYMPVQRKMALATGRRDLLKRMEDITVDQTKDTLAVKSRSVGKTSATRLVQQTNSGARNGVTLNMAMGTDGKYWRTVLYPHEQGKIKDPGAPLTDNIKESAGYNMGPLDAPWTFIKKLLALSNPKSELIDLDFTKALLGQGGVSFTSDKRYCLLTYRHEAVSFVAKFDSVQRFLPVEIRETNDSGTVDSEITFSYTPIKLANKTELFVPQHLAYVNYYVSSGNREKLIENEISVKRWTEIKKEDAPVLEHLVGFSETDLSELGLPR